MKKLNVLVLLSISVVVAACSTLVGDNVSPQLLAQTKVLFAPVQPVSEQEVNTPSAVLGRALFWDQRVSRDGKTACASCHEAADWSSDKRRFSINARGLPTTMHSQPVFLSQEQPALRWLGDRRDGAHQARGSITGSMGFDTAEAVVPVLKALGYEAMFRATFPGQADPVTPDNYAKAIEVYQRTLRTPAAFDKFLNGDNKALSSQQVVGLEKFVAYGCVGCHSGALLGGTAFQKFGLVKDYWAATGSEKVEPGRFAVTKKEEDKQVFRVAMLRNIAKTAPYFHDGSVAKLEDAVRVMAEVQLGRKAPDADVADIVAFLGSLTGDIPKHYAAPAQLVGTATAR